MAGHGPLYAAVQELLRGAKSAPLPQPPKRPTGGPLNIYEMKEAIFYADAHRRGLNMETEQAAARAIDRHRAMQSDGFDARKPGRGADGPGQCESFMGGSHAGFRFGAEALFWQTAVAAGHDALARLCEWWFGSYAAGVFAFNFKGKFAIVGPRFKNPVAEDGEPADQTSDAKIKVNQWRNPLAEELWRIVHRGAPAGDYFGGRLNVPGLFSAENCRRMAAMPFPKLLLPIQRVDFPGGGYRCWIEETTEARDLLGNDGLTTLEFRPGQRIPRRRYDFRPMPPPQEGAEWLARQKRRVYGA